MDSADMIIGFMSNLIVFPPIILIVLLFKRSKAATKRASRIDRGIEKAVEQERFRKPSDEELGRLGVGEKRFATEHDQDNNKGWPSFGCILGWLLCLVCIGKKY